MCRPRDEWRLIATKSWRALPLHIHGTGRRLFSSMYILATMLSARCFAADVRTCLRARLSFHYKATPGFAAVKYSGAMRLPHEYAIDTTSYAAILHCSAATASAQRPASRFASFGDTAARTRLLCSSYATFLFAFPSLPNDAAAVLCRALVALRRAIFTVDDAYFINTALHQHITRMPPVQY